jgi:hypothetical protein
VVWTWGRTEWQADFWAFFPSQNGKATQNAGGDGFIGFNSESYGWSMVWQTD